MLAPRNVLTFSIILLSALVLICNSSVSAKRISELKCDEYKELASTSHTPNTYCSIAPLASAEKVPHGENPHQAFLTNPPENGTYDYYCGGSLISDRFVLTAAQCQKYNSLTLVILGKYNLEEPSDDEVSFGIAEIIRHPDYKQSLIYHDIALVRLNETAPFSKFIRPACLWAGTLSETSSFMATGFGREREDAGELTSLLVKMRLDLFPSADCQQLFRGYRKLRDGMTNGQLCVGRIDAESGPCQGDGGGPLQMIIDPGSCVYSIVGVTSAGPSCDTNFRAISTNVSYYLDWIEAIVWPQ